MLQSQTPDDRDESVTERMERSKSDKDSMEVGASSEPAKTNDLDAGVQSNTVTVITPQSDSPQKNTVKSDADKIRDDNPISKFAEYYESDNELRSMKSKAPNRIRQFGQYLRIMEARLGHVEEKLRIENFEEEKEKEARKKRGEPICEIRSGEMDFFSGKVFTKDDDDDDDDDFEDMRYPDLQSSRRERKPYVIEVLVRSGASISAIKEKAPKELGMRGIKAGPRQDPETNKTVPKVNYPDRVRIRSSELLECLSEISQGRKDGFGDMMVFLSPFKLFMKKGDEIRAHLDQLEKDANVVKEEVEQSNAEISKKKKKTQDKAVKLLSHLRLLVQLLDTILAPTLHVYRSLKMRTATHIAFEHLYYLFDYGQEVFSTDGSNLVYRVYGWTGGRDSPIPPKANEDWQPGLVVDTYQYVSNGQSFGPLTRQFVISRYFGEREITSLPVYPLIYHESAVEIRDQIDKRADMYMELTSRNDVIHRQYSGASLDNPPEEYDSQVIVDQYTALRQNQEFVHELGVRNMTKYNSLETVRPCNCVPRCPDIISRDIHQDLDDDKQEALEWFLTNKHALQPPADHRIPNDEDRILLPHHVYGFVLRSRKWAKLNIDTIKPIKYENSFDKLVLPDGHAESVRALVMNHNGGPHEDGKHVEVAMDLVKGKGKGLIILLHGEPGVGKTSTAECIADHTKRPLFPITCGDIGSQAETVEANLEKTFQLAHKWGCVLLLDEADVFLQERTRDDLERNAVVSVFLRNMEYYSGILFLTTNRVGALDQAFRSRIHLSLFYPALKLEATVKIWEMHLDTTETIFEDYSREIIIERKEIISFAKKHFRKLKHESATWNGRQIRNAFQTAIALAEMDATVTKGIPRLSAKQFETVAKTSQEFDDYLKEAQGASSTALAKQDRLRHDRYVSKYEHTRSRDKRSSKAKSRKGLERDSSSSGSSSSSSSEETDESEEDTKKSKKKSKNSKKDKGKKKAKQESSDEESSAEEEVLAAKEEKKEKSKKKTSA